MRVRVPNVQATNELTVDATCVYMNTGEGLHRFVDPVDDEVYLYTQFEVADSRRMFAVFEQPDLKATYALTVTAPAHWMPRSQSSHSRRFSDISTTRSPAPTPSAISAPLIASAWSAHSRQVVSTHRVPSQCRV